MRPGATPPPGPLATTTVTLTSGTWRLAVPVAVPAGPTRWRVALPVFQSVTNQIVDAAVAEVESAGQRVSCQKGCGACCRQVVPIAHVEAELLRGVIDRLPEPRRSTVRARFADARQRLEAAGLLDPFRHPDRIPLDDWRPLALRYFALGIACPFLEDESCSIHPDRPLACREYLVTTPAEHCAHPTGESVDCVPLRMKPSNALMHAAHPGGPDAAWTPLILATEPAAGLPPEPSHTGPELVKAFFGQLLKPPSGTTDRPA